MTAAPAVGVLAMAYGTPLDRDDVAAYYTDIRRGRPPSAEQLAALVARYDAIGGTFPLREITDAQLDALEAALEQRAPGRFAVVLGTRHSRPSVAEGVGALAAQGIDRAVGLVLAPHWSTVSVGKYAALAAEAGEQHGVAVDTIPSWHLLPAYVDFLVGAVEESLAGLPDAEVVFTAHSVPERVVAMGDPYPAQLRETAEAVVARLSLPSWSVGWQSAGRTADPWLGPDVLEIVRDRAASGSAGLIVCACGFTGDHLEVAYDLDIEAAALAGSLGLPFARTRSMNADRTVLTGLAGLVCEAAGLP